MENNKTQSKKSTANTKKSSVTKSNKINEYTYYAEDIPVEITITYEQDEFVPIYSMNVSVISDTTLLILEKVRQELIKKVNLGIAEISDYKKHDAIEEKFEDMIRVLIDKYFPDSDEETGKFLRTYLKIESLGLGNLELLMNDWNLEEVVINQSDEPVWVYHKKYGWLKTNVLLKNEDQIKHYASIIGRRVGRQISVLKPLLDANLDEGDRVNATLNPVSTAGNTITIRKFSRDPWTITKFLKSKTIDPDSLALIWTAIQYEMSALIAGGTASGKTSALNVLSSFFPPNQRIISIEDTRELQLADNLHWVPLETRLPNPEGKGGVSMLDLLVNSLRMRPDRIVVGEIRRKQEAQVLMEAMHTGHSVYATIHANTAEETVTRLTNPPIEIPKQMLSSLAMVLVQNRNRRTGKRRALQVAEITSTGDARVLLQLNAMKDSLEKVAESEQVLKLISLYTGMTREQLEQDLRHKEEILKWMVSNRIFDINEIGKVMAKYYLGTLKIK